MNRLCFDRLDARRKGFRLLSILLFMRCIFDDDVDGDCDIDGCVGRKCLPECGVCCGKAAPFESSSGGTDDDADDVKPSKLFKPFSCILLDLNTIDIPKENARPSLLALLADLVMRRRPPPPV
mmetsp:Transcript_29546/g.45102  ORF Transcript_29546/g.45102 Transcript_29546/m.45102 type:complete len:123 (+) Transcript_29546:1306-1674(+)